MKTVRSWGMAGQPIFELYVHPPFELDGQLLDDECPFLDGRGPFFMMSCDARKTILSRARSLGKTGFCPGHFPHLAVEAFHRVCGADDSPCLVGVLEVLAEPFPVVAPGQDDHRALAAPFLFQSVQFTCGTLQ